MTSTPTSVPSAHRFRSPGRWSATALMACAAALLLFAAPTATLGQSVDSLIGRSPFFPEGFDPNPPPAQTPPQLPQPVQTFWEFRGFVTMGDSTRISLYDSRNNQSVWLDAQNGQAQGIQIVAFDLSSRSLRVNMNGTIQTLEIADSSYNGGAGGPPPPPPAPRGPSADNSPPQEGDGEIIRRPIRRRVIVPRRTDQ